MRRALLLCLLSLALPAHAADAPDGTGLAEIRDLGRLNGQALACAHAEAATRVKALMLKHAPKTRRYGAAFEEGTQESFLAQTRNSASCSDAQAFSGQLDGIAKRLQAALPAEAAATAP